MPAHEYEQRYRVMRRIVKAIETLTEESRRMVAFEVHRLYGGPLTGAERASTYRTRHAVVTDHPPENSNDCVTSARDAGVTNGSLLDPDSSEVVSSSASSKNQQLRRDATEILGFLNQKAGRSFRFTRANLGFIEARLREGATVQECKSVIARQVRAWISDPKMSMYLRPETLFNATKFESYRGQAAPEPSDV